MYETSASHVCWPSDEPTFCPKLSSSCVESTSTHQATVLTPRKQTPIGMAHC